MTREGIKKHKGVFDAWLEGAEVEFLHKDKWISTCDTPEFHSHINYRINPQPKYRPFQLGDDFNGVFEKRCIVKYDPDREYLVDDVSIGRDSVTFYFDSCLEGGSRIQRAISSKEALNDVKFTNGEPFGVKKEKTTIPPMAY